MTDLWARAAKTEWLIQWITYAIYAAWQLTWHFAFKIKYNWLTFLLTYWAAMLFIAELPKFAHEDNFTGTDWELLYYVIRMCAFVSWAILSGLLFFWGRKSEIYVANAQKILLAIWFTMVMTVIIVWYAGYQSAAVSIKNAVLGFWGVVFPDIGFIIFAISLKSPIHKTFRNWTICLIVIWFLSAIVAVLVLILAPTSVFWAAVVKGFSIPYFAVQNLWVYQSNLNNAFQRSTYKTFYTLAQEPELQSLQIELGQHTIATTETVKESNDNEEEKLEEKENELNNNNNNEEIIDTIISTQLEVDWTYKYTPFPPEFNIFNTLYLLFNGILGFILFLINLSLFFAFIYLPIIILFIFDKLFFISCCRGYTKPITYNPFIYARKIMADERIYLSTYNPIKRGIIWYIRNYIQIFYAGLDRIPSIVGGDAELKHVENYQSLYGKDAKYFPCDSSISTSDYNTSLELYSDPQQAHEFSTLYKMHSVVYTFCPFYSLGQTMKINPFEFINELHWEINKIGVENFVTHKTAKNTYVPSDISKPPQLLASSMAVTYNKFFGKAMNEKDVKYIESNMFGLLLIGSIPENFAYFLGGKLLPTQYWRLVCLWRKLLLTENKNSKITKLIFKLAKKYGYSDNIDTLNYCINSFCVEVFPGNAGIATAIGVGLTLFKGANGKQYIENFKENPQAFAMECIRISEIPYAGRTVLRGYKKIQISDKYYNMYNGNAIISQIGPINRCPYKFKEPNVFNSKRDNLNSDVYSFGSTEKLIRENKAVKQCPLHDWAILMVQEQLARIQGVEITVTYQNKSFPNSYEI